MLQSLQPFNISLLIPKAEDLKGIRPVKVQDIFSNSSQFHPDGLFSVETFGKVGEEKRNRLFSYIDLNIDILHPLIFKTLLDLKGLYGEIMSGKSYAIFDSKTRDFVKADISTGQTGYSFFVNKLLDKSLVFPKNDSDRRDFNIKLIEKYRDNCMFSKLVVMPAGMRDFTFDENNKPSEDEINNMYRKVIGNASLMNNVNSVLNAEYLDNTRYNLQIAVLEIYNYIVNMLEGKSRLIQGKWAGRKVINSTRNVITSYVPDVTELHSSKTVKSDQTVVGLYQYMRCILPLAVKHLRDTFLADIFTGPNAPATLVNKKTLKKEQVLVDPEHYDEWMTYEGLEKVMARFGEEGLRNDSIEIDGYYMGLIYKGDYEYRFMQSIDELPDNRLAKDVHPITFAELLYLSVYKDSHEVPCLVTRYPITGYGSVYPSYVYLKTTVKSQILNELGEDWERTGFVANEFPISSESYYNSMSPYVNRLGKLGAKVGHMFRNKQCEFY